MWKLLDKVGRRKGNYIANELLRAFKNFDQTKNILATYPAEGFRNFSDVAIGYAQTLDPKSYKFAQSENQSDMVSLLLSWYDDMMRRLFDGEPFTARDAVTYFGGGAGVSGNRMRRHSVSL